MDAILKAALEPQAAQEVARRLDLHFQGHVGDSQRVGLSGPRTLWGEVRRATGDPLIGMHTALRMDANALGSFLKLLQSCPDLRSVIDVARGFLSLVDTGHRATLRVEKDTAMFEWQFVGRAGSLHDVDFFVTLGWRITKSLMPDFALSELQLPHRPEADKQAYEDFFGCPVHFEAEAAVSKFPAKFLDMPIPGGDREAFERLSVWAENHLPPPMEGNRLCALEQAYDVAVRDGQDDAVAIAKRLGLSTRTLRRQLQNFGTTHREQRDRARRAVAVALLKGGEVALSEIATRVGFTDAAAFTRAFRRWTGTTPGAYRRMQRIHREQVSQRMPLYSVVRDW